MSSINIDDIDSLILQYQKVTSDDVIAEAVELADKEKKKLSEEEVAYLRWRAKNDLFFLTTGVLGYVDLSPNLHGHFCSWLELTKGDQFRLELLPRSHFKSTTVTIADSIQSALPDVVNPFSDSAEITKSPWPRNLGPDIRILLGHETSTGAQRFLTEITSHFCTNVKLMALFPELVPNRKEHRMNLNELELPRQAHWAEPTFDTIGVGARAQGRHYNLIKLDDIFGDKARDSKTERDSTIQWFDNIQSFLVALAVDHIDIVGTRYSLDDVYGHAIDAYGPLLVKYIRRIEERVVVAKDKTEVRPIFPERFTTKSLSILRKNKKVWAAQYCNDPHEGLAEFSKDWLRYYQWKDKNTIVVFSGHVQTVVNLRDCDIVCFIDPATTGSTGITVTAVDKHFRIYVIDCIKDSLRPEELVNMIFRIVQKWWPRTVAIEEVVFSAVYAPWVRREQSIRNVRFGITPVKPKQSGRSPQAKTDRVRGLATYFSAGQIFFHTSQTDLIAEYNNFGATDDIHMLDSLSYGPEIWRAGTSAEQWKQHQQAEQQVMHDRDFTTGYSTI